MYYAMFRPIILEYLFVKYSMVDITDLIAAPISISMEHSAYVGK